MIKVYYTKVFPHIKEDTFFALLNKIEIKRRQKILALTDEKARLRALTAGSLLYDTLCRKLGFLKGEAEPFEIAYGKNGKPYLAQYPDIHFNLSHSGDYVCCAVSDVPVGIDLQKITDVKEGIARRFFTDKDNQRLARCDGENWKKLFFRMWSVKESYIKLTGKGMTQGLDTFEIDWQQNRIFAGSTPERQLAAESMERVNSVAYFEESDCLPQYCFCICAGEKPLEVIWSEIVLKEIVLNFCQ